MVWTRALRCGAIDYYRAIRVDGQGEVLINGMFYDQLELGPADLQGRFTSAGDADAFIARFDAAGKLLWTRQFGGPGYDDALGMDVDPAGNVFLAGRFTGSVDLDPGPQRREHLAAGLTDLFVCRLDRDGQLEWLRQFGGPGQELPYRLALDRARDIHVAADFQQAIDVDPGPATKMLLSHGGWDALHIVLDPEGVVRQASHFGGPGNDHPLGMTVDPSGRVFMAGSFAHEADLDPGPGIRSIKGNAIGNYFLISLDYITPDAMGVDSSASQEGILQHPLSAPSPEFVLSLVRTFNMPVAPVRSMAYSPDGKLLAAGGAQRTICVWNTADWSVARRFDGLSSKIKGVAWAPDNRRLAGLEEDALSVWDVSSGKQLWAHRDAGGRSCEFSPDGRLIAAGYADGGLLLFPADTGKPVRPMRAHRGELRAMAFNTDGRTIVTSGNDGAIRFWNVNTGLELMSFAEPVQVNHLAFSADGQTLAAALHDGTVKVWKSRP